MISKDILKKINDLDYGGILIAGPDSNRNHQYLNDILQNINPNYRVVYICEEKTMFNSSFSSDILQWKVPENEKLRDLLGVSHCKKELIKNCLRTDPDWIILDEMKREAYYWLQSVQTGHIAISTITVNSTKEIREKLLQQVLHYQNSLPIEYIHKLLDESISLIIDTTYKNPDYNWLEFNSF